MNTNGREPRWTCLDHAVDLVFVGALSGNASHVLHIMAVHYANPRGEAWPSQPTLAAATNLSESTVRRAIHELERHGLISLRKGSPARTRGYVYTLRNPVTATGLIPKKSGHSYRISRERQSVTAKPSKASDTTQSPLSDAGDLALSCSTGHSYRISPAPAPLQNR